MSIIYKFWSALLRYKYHCPLCENHVKNFLPLPDFYRLNLERVGFPYTFSDAETINPEAYLCPVCQASDRDRLYALYFHKWFEGNGHPMKVLEIAPSKPLSDFLRRINQIELRTADKFMEGVDDRVDITDLSCYMDNSYDCFICSHVLEHVPDDRKALSELYRVLKPGRWGILMVPILLAIDEIDEDPSIQDEAERWRRFGQNDHVRMYSKNGFVTRVQGAGFSVEQYDQEFFGQESFDLHGISRRSVLYMVRK